MRIGGPALFSSLSLSARSDWGGRKKKHACSGMDSTGRDGAAPPPAGGPPPAPPAPGGGPPPGDASTTTVQVREEGRERRRETRADRRPRPSAHNPLSLPSSRPASPPWPWPSAWPPRPPDPRPRPARARPPKPSTRFGRRSPCPNLGRRRAKGARTPPPSRPAPSPRPRSPGPSAQSPTPSLPAWPGRTWMSAATTTAPPRPSWRPCWLRTTSRTRPTPSGSPTPRPSLAGPCRRPPRGRARGETAALSLSAPGAWACGRPGRGGWSPSSGPCLPACACLAVEGPHPTLPPRRRRRRRPPRRPPPLPPLLLHHPRRRGQLPVRAPQAAVQAAGAGAHQGAHPAHPRGRRLAGGLHRGRRPPPPRRRRPLLAPLPGCGQAVRGRLHPPARPHDHGPGSAPARAARRAGHAGAAPDGPCRRAGRGRPAAGLPGPLRPGARPVGRRGRALLGPPPGRRPLVRRGREKRQRQQGERGSVLDHH